MAVVTIPATATPQPSQSQELNDDGTNSFSRSWLDSYSIMKTCLDGISTGDTYDGLVVKHASLSRSPGNLGILTLSLTISDTSSSTGTQVALDETWSIKSVRIDRSILAYCGISPGSNPQRTDIEAWLKEPDGKLANEYKYEKTDGSVVTIDQQATKNLIDKFREGKDSVMRFYPQITKKRTYSLPPQSVFENLAEIDTPSVGTTATSMKIKKPGNLLTIISDRQWLKVQDDCDQTADSKFIRTESWIGTVSSEESWDSNFYGTGNERWGFPYQAN